MKNEKLKRIILAGMFTALVCVATMFIRIPWLKGYVNLGDIVVIMSGWILGPLYGFFAGGVGSALADLFSGYPVYVPGTFIIKGLMAPIAYFTLKFFTKYVKKDIPSQIFAAIIVELIKTVGYTAYDSILYSFPTAIAGIGGSFLQDLFGVVGSVLIYSALQASLAAAKRKKA